MKKKVQLMVLLTILALILSGCGEPSTVLNESIGNERFVVFYETNDTDAAKTVLEVLDNCYKRIIDDLQCSSFRTKVFLYPDLKTFHQAIGRRNAPDWVVGTGHFDTIRMVSPTDPGPSHNADSILKVAVHEFVHCAVHQLVYEHKGEVRITEAKWDMRWLFEGIALYEAGQFRNPKDFDYIRQGNYPSLTDTRKQTETPTEVYNLGYTFIEYINETWGFDQVRDLLLELADIEGVLGVEVAELEKGWHDYIQQRYVSRP